MYSILIKLILFFKIIQVEKIVRLSPARARAKVKGRVEKEKEKARGKKERVRIQTHSNEGALGTPTLHSLHPVLLLKTYFSTYRFQCSTKFVFIEIFINLQLLTLFYYWKQVLPQLGVVETMLPKIAKTSPIVYRFLLKIYFNYIKFNFCSFKITCQCFLQ